MKEPPKNAATTIVMVDPATTPDVLMTFKDGEARLTVGRSTVIRAGDSDLHHGTLAADGTTVFGPSFDGDWKQEGLPSLTLMFFADAVEVYRSGQEGAGATGGIRDISTGKEVWSQGVPPVVMHLPLQSTHSHYAHAVYRLLEVLDTTLPNAAHFRLAFCAT